VHNFSKCWPRTLFLANFEFKGSHSCRSIVPFQFVKNNYFKFLQGSVATLFRWSWKFLWYFVPNLPKTLHINFYQNRSSIVEVIIKKFWCVFYAPQCIPRCCLLHQYAQWIITGRQHSLLCKPCTSHRRDVCSSVVRPSICLSVRHTLALSVNDAS